MSFYADFAIYPDLSFRKLVYHRVRSEKKTSDLHV